MPMVQAALVTPVSGPLARFGTATAIALRLWAEHFAGTDRIDLKIFDTHPRAAEAVREAERTCPDLLFGPYGSHPMRLVATATSRLVWNHSGAGVEPRQNIVNVLAPAASYFAGTLEALQRTDPTIRRVCVLHSDTGFSRCVAHGAAETAERLGLHSEKLLLPADPAEADVLLVAGRFEDELAAAMRLTPGRWPAVGLVSAGVDEVLVPLGTRREGLLGPAQWLPSAAPTPDEGPTARDFVAAYRARTGTDPPYPATQAFAAGIIAQRCLHDSGGADDSALHAAARRLDCTTVFGRFRLDCASGHQIGHRILTVQWQNGVRTVVWPPEQAQSTMHYPLR
jgi:branched-chain amino acid transport system substrate-binding protein